MKVLSEPVAISGLDARRPVLGGRAGYALVAAVVGLCLFASVTPSPLYGTYARLWHFSALTLTLVYATYAFGVLVTLLLAGGASDQVGRRPVLMVSLGVLMVSTVLYAVADSVAWLYAARALQGLATGAALSTASASMLDFHPRRDAARVGQLNGIASAAGVGLGALVSAAIVQAAVAPRVLPYVLLLVLFAAAFVGSAYLPEPVAGRTRLRLSPQRPHVPPVVRRPFTLAGLAVLSSWSIAGLSFALGPQLSGLLFHSTNFVVSALGIVVLGGAACLAALPTRKIEPWASTTIGSVALSAGMVLIVLAAAWGSAGYFIGGSILAGAGFGLAFLGGLRGLVAAIPAEHRSAVIAAFYIVAYASLSVPAILAGIFVPHLGLAPTFEVFGSIVAGIALIVTSQAWRSRPACPPSRYPIRTVRQLEAAAAGC
jgi:MFS family permease